MDISQIDVLCEVKQVLNDDKILVGYADEEEAMYRHQAEELANQEEELVRELRKIEEACQAAAALKIEKHEVLQIAKAEKRCGTLTEPARIRAIACGATA